jgi:hypothetical protein
MAAQINRDAALVARRRTERNPVVKVVVVVVVVVVVWVTNSQPRPDRNRNTRA